MFWLQHVTQSSPDFTVGHQTHTPNGLHDLSEVTGLSCLPHPTENCWSSLHGKPASPICKWQLLLAANNLGATLTLTLSANHIDFRSEKNMPRYHQLSFHSWSQQVFLCNKYSKLLMHFLASSLISCLFVLFHTKLISTSGFLASLSPLPGILFF